MTDLEEIRLKEVADLSEEDKKSINENWGKLTDEEHNYFGTVRVEEKKEDEFKLPFKSQEELDKYVADKVQVTIDERNKVRAEARKAKESGEGEFFPKGYSAKDWNEPFKQVVPKIVSQVVSEIEKKNQATRDALNKINQEFDKELDTIAATDKNVPAKGTKEREDWEADVAAVGQKYHQHNMTDAYDIWKALNAAKPPATSQPAPLPREGVPATQNDLVGKVGRGYGAGTNPRKTMYKIGQSKKLDEMVEARMREEGIDPE